MIKYVYIFIEKPSLKYGAKFLELTFYEINLL